MARWFSEDPAFSEISPAEKAIRDRIVAVMARHTQEMEGYSYYGSNPGISEDDYEDIAEELMKEFGLK